MTDDNPFPNKRLSETKLFTKEQMISFLCLLARKTIQESIIKTHVINT